jgi:FkbM family methyltransferase
MIRALESDAGNTALSLRAAADLKIRVDHWLVAKGMRAQRSYSQCGEDLVIRFLFNLLGVARPGYMDLGAHHPTYLSNTKKLYSERSCGINVEANPDLIAGFRRYRRRDLNLNVGIVPEHRNGQSVDFYVMNAPAMSTFSADEARRLEAETSIRVVKTIPVSVRGLNSLVNEHCAGAFPDLLTVDIEGTDELVVPALYATEGPRRPKVVCIETLSYSESGGANKRQDLIDAIRDVGYEVYADTYINTIFKRSDLTHRNASRR